MRRLWPGVAAAAALLALVVLFYRGLFQGLILGDYDAFVYFYPLRYYAAEAIKQGRFPLWNPDLFLGVPFFANVQTAVLYPPNLLFLLFPTPYAFSASVVFHVLLAGFSMYLFSRRVLETSWIPAVLAGVAFMLGGFLSSQVGHINQLNASAWMPLVLVLFDEALRRRSPGLVLATAAVGAVQFLAGHTQEWYFSMVAVGLFALWRVASPTPRRDRSSGMKRLPGAATPEETDGRARGPAPIAGAALDLRTRLRSDTGLAGRLYPVAYLLPAVVVLAGLVAVQLAPTLELSRESLRGGGMSFWDATSFSLPPTSALYTLLPAFPSTLFSEYVAYVGVVTILLAAFGMLLWSSRPITVLMAALAALGLFMALGRYNPFYQPLFNLVPGLDLFRVPARWLFIYTFGAAGLAALGAQQLLDLADRRGHPRAQARRESGIPAPIRVGVPALGLGVAISALLLLARMADPAPSPDQIAVWAGLGVLGVVLIGLGSLGPIAARLSLGVALIVIVGELWAAGAGMDSRHPIPAQAFRPDRTSTSYLLADAASRQDPGRLLSFATDQYEVKETPDYKKEFAWLDEEALIQFLVDVKLSESLSPNVPLEYGLSAVDGYDGGILPLKRFATFKSLLFPSADVPADNPIRRHLRYVPPDLFLDLMNVRYVLGTKIQDTMVDNVYYDRGITVALSAGDLFTLNRLPSIDATSVGIISSTSGARELENGVEAAEVVLTDESSGVHKFPLRMGIETGETPEQDGQLPPAAHSKPRAVKPWTPEIAGEDYFAKIALNDRRPHQGGGNHGPSA